MLKSHNIISKKSHRDQKTHRRRKRKEGLSKNKSHNYGIIKTLHFLML